MSGLQVELDTLESVDEKLKAFYEEHEGKFKLKVEGLEDTGALKRAKDHEKTARQQAEKQLKELQDQMNDLQSKLKAGEEEDLRKKGDIEALDNSWKNKLSKRESELQGEIDSLKGNLSTILVDGVAMKMAAELAIEGSADLLLPHIKARLAADQKDGQFTTVVMDNQGKPSALTLDELKTEISSNQVFAPVIAGSKASGGGAGGRSSGGAAIGGDLSKMNTQEKLKYFDTKR